MFLCESKYVRACMNIGIVLFVRECLCVCKYVSVSQYAQYVSEY